MDVFLGFPFDTLTFEAFGKKYTGQFYWYNRKKTLGFIENIKSRVEQNEKIEGARDKSMIKSEEECEPIKKLKELAELEKQGIITKEEFGEKKKKLLGDL